MLRDEFIEKTGTPEKYDPNGDRMSGFHSDAFLRKYIKWLESEVTALRLQNTAHNSDYTKCFESLDKELSENNPMRYQRREEVRKLVQKHFA